MLLDVRDATDDQQPGRADATVSVAAVAATRMAPRAPRLRQRRCDFGPAHHAVAIPDLELAVGGFMDLYGGAGRRPMALPLDLEIPVFRAHDQVIRGGPLLPQPKDRAPWDRHVKVSGEAGGRAKS
jgi:hypothetical protein